MSHNEPLTTSHVAKREYKLLVLQYHVTLYHSDDRRSMSMRQVEQAEVEAEANVIEQICTSILCSCAANLRQASAPSRHNDLQRQRAQRAEFDWLI